MSPAISFITTYVKIKKIVEYLYNSELVEEGVGYTTGWWSGPEDMTPSRM